MIRYTVTFTQRFDFVADDDEQAGIIARNLHDQMDKTAILLAANDDRHIVRLYASDRANPERTN